jgi:hypothetical protein
MPTSGRSQVYSAQEPGSTWQGNQTRTPHGGLHSRRKILGVQIRLAGLQEHTDLIRSRVRGAQLGWPSYRHTKVLQDLGIKARRPHEGHFGAQMTNIAASHPAEPICHGIDNLSDRHTNHGGPTKS